MSYCRWSSDGFRSDVYAYLDVSGGVTVHIARYRQRKWYNMLCNLQESLVERDGLWIEDFSKPPREIAGREYPALRLLGGWWRWPLRRVLSWLQHPQWGSRKWFWWPHSWTHYEIKLPNADGARYGLGFGEAADYLVELREAGYLVPQYAIDRLREEEAEDPEAAFRHVHEKSE